jgi:hypothetical protein
MTISMQKASAPAGLEIPSWDTAITGPVVDDRGRAAVAFARGNSATVLTIQYDEVAFEMSIGDERINAEEVGDHLRSRANGRILFETTTLGFVETFLCCRGLRCNGLKKLHLLYVEPLTYNAPRRSQVLHKRDFELSDIVPGYRAIPGAAFHLSGLKTQHAVFFLGYEEHRLGVALEDFQQTLPPENCSVIFGVPAFQPGWEMNSFANNVRVIRSKDISGGIHFCGAENPAAAVDVLEEVRASLSPGGRMLVAPIGTKPMGIAAALFAAENLDVGLLYDHPKRRAGRSSESSSWHVYEATF